MARIIFIEGLQGCGKTTISEWLSNQMRPWGRECAWYNEDAEHPIGRLYDPEKCPDVADYIETSTERWSDFASREQQEARTTVFDGRLLMCPVCGLLRFAVGADRIVPFIKGLAEAVSGMSPLLVYLHAPDYPPVFAAMCRRRGEKTEEIYVDRHNKSQFAKNREAYGYDGLVQFELEVKAVVEQLVDLLNMPKLALDITGQEWDVYKRRIMQFVEPFLENNVPDLV